MPFSVSLLLLETGKCTSVCCLLVYFLLRSKSREIFWPLTKYGDDDDDVGTPADVVAGGGDVAGEGGGRGGEDPE